MTSAVATPFYPHQLRGLERIRELRGRCGVFAEMGTGKTRMTLAYVAEQRFQRVLIVCPLSVIGVWLREATLAGFDLPPMLDLTEAGSVADRAAWVRASQSAILLINYESYWREPLRAALLRWQPEALVLDEAHRIRHRGTKHTRFAHTLADRPYVRSRLALTGTPITNGLQDAYSLYRFIDPNIFGRRWQDFSAEYLTMGGFEMREIVGYRHVEDARRLIEQSSFQCRKDEAIDLPPRMDVEVPIRLSPGTREVYDRLKREAIMRLRNADGEDRVVLARIVLTLVLRLQQITSGFTRGFDEHDMQQVGEDIHLSDEKTDACVELIEDAAAQGQRVVVFTRFIHDLNSVERALPARLRVARIDGSVPPRDRTRIQEDFRRGMYDVVIAQIKTASLGIDLTPANIGIFYSVGFSLDDFQQAKDRLHRMGQSRPVTYYHLLAQNTVDDRVYAALSKKISIASQVTRLSYALDLIQQ